MGRFATYIDEDDTATADDKKKALISHKNRWRTLMILSLVLWLVSITVTVLAYYFLAYAPFFMWAWLVFGFSIGYVAILLAYFFLNWCAPQKVLPTWWHVLVGLSFIPLIIMLSISLAFVFPNTQSDLHMYRLGSIDASSARIWVRTREHGTLGIRYKSIGNANWISHNETVSLSKDKDYTGSFHIAGLTSSQEYEFQITDNGNTVFQGRFSTAPLPNESTDEFVFYFGSCFLEGYPIFRGLHSKAPEVLINTVAPTMDLFLNLGDLIYADAPIFLGPSKSIFYRKYRETLVNPGLQKIFTSVPNLHQFGDHEIFNDWVGDAWGWFDNGIADAWMNFLGASNPYPSNPVPDKKYHFTYDYGSVSMFILETHIYRNYDEETMLGQDQLNELLNWLTEKNSTATFKFIMSPEPWSDIFGDKLLKNSVAWAGYLDERQVIFDHITNNHISGVIFLSADKHASFVTKLGNETNNFYEFSVSPFSAFDTSIGGLSKIDFVSDDATDTVLEVFAEKRMGAAASYFGIGRVNGQDQSVTIEIWDYYNGFDDEYVNKVYSYTLRIEDLQN